MEPYPKIDSLFVRDEKTFKFTTNRQFKDPAVEYLRNNRWIYTEKIHGMNCRIIWDAEIETVIVSGRTDNSQMSNRLFQMLLELVPVALFKELYPETSMCIYGEGFGLGINKGGKYNPDENEFRVFDIKIDRWWLKWADVGDICMKLGLQRVPVVGEGTIDEAIKLLMTPTMVDPEPPIELSAKPKATGFDVGPAYIQGLQSRWGPFLAEGLVLRCPADLVDRREKRIMVKMKYKDFA